MSKVRRCDLHHTPSQRVSRHAATTSSTQGAPARTGSCRSDVEGPGHDVGERRHRPRGDARLAQVPGHEPAGVLGHVARPGHADLHPAGGEVGARAPRGGIRRRPAVDDDAPAGDVRQHLVEGGAPHLGQRAEPGQRRAHRQPVGGDPVAGAHGTVERRDDDEPAVRAAAGGGVERGEVEGVVEHAGVDLGGGGGGCGGEREVARHLVEQSVGDAEQGRRRRGSGWSRRALRRRARGWVARAGNDHVAASAGLPRRRFAFDSDGGSRISTGTAYGG